MRRFTTAEEYTPYSVRRPGNFGLYLSDREWQDYGLRFRDMRGDTLPRDHIGFSASVRYTNDTGRNDIIETRVVNDGKNLYFLIETAEEIQLDFTANNCMNIWLDVAEGGWEGYDFVLNRSLSSEGKTSLERVNADFTFQKVADVSYAVLSNRMVVSVPLKDLGLKKKISFNFKVADNVTNPGDIMDYYVNGDSAPIGRLNYHYAS